MHPLSRNVAVSPSEAISILRVTLAEKGKRRATTERLQSRELVLQSVLAGWQLPTGERDECFRWVCLGHTKDELAV